MPAIFQSPDRRLPVACRLSGRVGNRQNGVPTYYYSFPHLQIQGTEQGSAVTGLAWMDHEFATDQLAPDQQGWKWMGLHLPSGDLMRPRSR
ncbi:MAG: lipocalin-like domain-containing protein [Terriglobales bacterium]